MSDSNDITLTSNDVMGIIQRSLRELDAYLSQAPQAIDPNVGMAYLERAAAFMMKLPPKSPPLYANGNVAEASEARN